MHVGKRIVPMAVNTGSPSLGYVVHDQHSALGSCRSGISPPTPTRAALQHQLRSQLLSHPLLPPQVLGQPRFLAVVLLALFSAAQLMFWKREVEARGEGEGRGSGAKREGERRG